MTEASMITSNPYDIEKRRAGTIGLPLPDVKLRIASIEGGQSATTELPRGEVGMIQIKGPNVFAGYWNMPEKTASEFTTDGYFITGDVGSQDNDGYVTISGREKDLIITGGLNVYPREVEMAIDALPGVLESAVFGVPHPDFGEGVTAVVIRKPGLEGEQVNEKSVSLGLKDTLAKFKQPKTILFLSEIPRNTMGKVQKAVLRTTYSNLYTKKE
jgi:malonyl-CoA/methylmalonyl-CoA synthetase